MTDIVSDSRAQAPLSVVSDALEALPETCPAWCASGRRGHLQALEEGCDVESSCEHMSVDLGGLLRDEVNHLARRTDRVGGGSWNVRLAQGDHAVMQMPVVRLEVSKHRESGGYRSVTLDLTTSEARTLAAQLGYLADQEELHRYDGLGHA